MKSILIAIVLLAMGCSPEISYRSAQNTSTAAHFVSNLEVPFCDPELVQEAQALQNASNGILAELSASLTHLAGGLTAESQVFEIQLAQRAGMISRECQAFFAKWGDYRCQTADANGEIRLQETTEIKQNCDNLKGMDRR